MVFGGWFPWRGPVRGGRLQELPGALRLGDDLGAHCPLEVVHTCAYVRHMTAVETLPAPAHGPRIWPLSLKAYRTLGDLGLIPKKTKLLHGQM